MASTFKSEVSTSLAASEVTVYTCPAATEAIVIGFHIANTSGAEIAVDVKKAGAVLINDAPIPYGSTLVPFEGKLVLEATETLTVTPNTAGACDVSVSILELS